MVSCHVCSSYSPNVLYFLVDKLYIFSPHPKKNFNYNSITGLLHNKYCTLALKPLAIEYKIKVKYTVNGLRLQANIVSAVLTQIEQECTCSVPKVYMQCRLNVGWISFAVLTKCLEKKSISNSFPVGV